MMEPVKVYLHNFNDFNESEEPIIAEVVSEEPVFISLSYTQSNTHQAVDFIKIKI